MSAYDITSNNPVWEGSGVTIRDEELTTEQWQALVDLQQRHNLENPLKVIRGLDYIGIYAAGMFIGIERDGHCHT